MKCARRLRREGHRDRTASSWWNPAVWTFYLRNTKMSALLSGEQAGKGVVQYSYCGKLYCAVARIAKSDRLKTAFAADWRILAIKLSRIHLEARFRSNPRPCSSAATLSFEAATVWGQN